MQLGNVINIALGLTFTFFILSLIASSIQEFIAAIFKWRGTYLNKALDVILSDNANATFEWYGLRDWLNAHLTRHTGMSVAKGIARNDAKAKSKANKSGAAEPNNQAQQQPPPTPEQLEEAAKAKARLNTLLNDLRTHPLLSNVPASLPSYISGKNFAVALLSVLRDGSESDLIAQSTATINALPDGDLKKTLTAFLFDAGADIDKFRSNIESWFDGAMDRLSGIYKRVAQFALLIIGFPLAVILNVNALHLAYVFWTMDPSNLAALADVAAQAKAVDPTNAPDAAAALDLIRTNLSQLKNPALPIGWSQGIALPDINNSQTWLPHLGHFITHHLLGWLITTAAISLGAPFWFDLIQKLIPLRSSGPKPSPDSDTTLKIVSAAPSP